MQKQFTRTALSLVLPLGLIANLWIVFTLQVFAVQSPSTMPKLLSLPAIFAPHMVLQRNQPIVIWGTSAAGEQISVTLTLENEIKVKGQSVSDEEGKWRVTLPPQVAGGPYRLRVKDPSGHINVEDVLIGDVWLAAGQSNMEWKLGWKVEGGPREIATSEYPKIRFFNVDNKFAAREQSAIPGSGWKLASEQTSPDFSAIAWFFAKHNHLQKQVPVGIIDSTWGGTPAEAWTSLDALQHISGYAKEAKDLRQNASKWQQQFDHNEILEKHKAKLLNNKQVYQQGDILHLDYDDSAWQQVELPNSGNHPLSDIVWLRKVIHLSQAPQQAQLALSALNQLGQIFINGKLVYKEAGYDVVADALLGENTLHQGDNIIVIRATSGWDNKVIVGEKGLFKLRLDNADFDLSGQWKYSNKIEPPLPKVKYYNWKPGVLYNAMIHPLVQYSLNGVIWYQGENNVGTAQLYPELFKGLINDWRAKWQSPELPFLFVQLASYNQPKDQPAESDWAQLRAAQANALSLPNTAMAVTIDIGDAIDIHPRNKKTVADRLWLAAKHVVYGDDTVFSGPKMREVQEFEHNGHSGLLVKFDHVHQGLQADSSALKGFTLAVDGGQFVTAEAKILGQQAFVWSPKIKQPKRIRYAWADNSQANLYNQAMLPALPFQAQVE